MPLHVRSPRASLDRIRRELDDPLILDVTPKGPEPWVKFSPFYPHGGIPVPFSPGVYAQSVTGIWHGLTVFESCGIDTSRFDNQSMRGIQRTVRRFGKVRGHQMGVTSDQLLMHRDARGLIYLPAYEWVLHNRVADLVEELASLSRQREVVLLDYHTNENLLDTSRPLSHAALIKAFVNLEDDVRATELALVFLWVRELMQAAELDRAQCEALQRTLSQPRFRNIYPIRYPGTWDRREGQTSGARTDWQRAADRFADSMGEQTQKGELESRAALETCSMTLDELAAAVTRGSDSGVCRTTPAAGERPPSQRPAAEGLAYDENVRFTVYRPRSVQPEKWYNLLAYAHLDELPSDADPGDPEPEQQVSDDAAARLGDKLSDYRKATGDSAQPIPKGGEIVFRPEVAGFRFNPRWRRFSWEEPVQAEEFRFSASQELDGTTARGKLLCLLGDILLAEVNLVIQVTSRAADERGEAKRERATTSSYRKIFASYSHDDEHIVRQFERYAKGIGDRYVRDWVDLRSGDPWSERLLDLIDESDVFQLFWSENSCASPYVEREWRYALSRGKKHLVRPLYWQKPLPPASGELPEPLRPIHFAYIGRDLDDRGGGGGGDRGDDDDRPPSDERRSSETFLSPVRSFPDDRDRMLQRQSESVFALAEDLGDWLSKYHPERAETDSAAIRHHDQWQLAKLRRQAADLHRASKMPAAAALCAASQTGKSLLLSRVLRPLDPDCSPLGRDERLGAPSYLKSLSFDLDVNPSRGANEASAVVMRFTTADRDDHTALQAYPVMARCMARGDWLRVLSRGFCAECAIPPDAVWQKKGLERLLAKCGQEAAGPKGDPDWQADLLETYAYIRRLMPFRYRADEIFFADLLSAHPLQPDGYVELAAQLWWNGWPELTALFRRVCEFLDKVRSEGRQGVLCHWAAARFLLDSHRADAHENASSRCFPKVAWSDLVDTRQDGWYLLDYQPGSGPPRDELSVVQAAVLELVLPLLPHRLGDEWGRLLRQMDVLDFPGLRASSLAGSLDRAESEAQQMELVKRGKLSYLFESYTEKQLIDALFVLLRGGNLDLRGLLKEFVDRWGRTRYGQENWPQTVGRAEPALFLGLTGIDDEIAYGPRPVEPAVYNARLRTVQEVFREVVTDFGGRGRPFTNIYPIRFPGTWDADSERRAEIGADRWDRAKQAFLSAELVRTHVNDAEKKWQAAMDDRDGGVGLIASAIAHVASAQHKQSALQRDIENTRSELIELARRWTVAPGETGRDAAAKAPGHRELLELLGAARS